MSKKASTSSAEKAPKKRKCPSERGAKKNADTINYVLDTWEQIEAFCERVRKRKGKVSRRVANMKRN